MSIPNLYHSTMFRCHFITLTYINQSLNNLNYILITQYNFFYNLQRDLTEPVLRKAFPHYTHQNSSVHLLPWLSSLSPQTPSPLNCRPLAPVSVLPWAVGPSWHWSAVVSVVVTWPGAGPILPHFRHPPHPLLQFRCHLPLILLPILTPLILILRNVYVLVAL